MRTTNVSTRMNLTCWQSLNGEDGGVKYESHLNKYNLRRCLKIGRVWKSLMSRGTLFQSSGAG